MKRFHSYRLLLPLLVLIASACAKSGQPNDGNGISLSLSVAPRGSVSTNTKMTTAITQDGAGFRGIEQVYVVPFQTNNSGPVGNGNPRLGGSNVYIQNPTISQTGLVANNNSHLYDIAEVPLKTNRVLAYGKASDAGEISSKAGKHKNGVLTPSGLDDLNVSEDISFCLEPILEPADRTSLEQTADNLIAALNSVVETLEASGDADILAFLDVFAMENEISACSYQTLYRFEQNILGVLSLYSGSNPDAINAVMTKLSDLQNVRTSAGTGFPTTYGVPEGAIGMWWNGHRFVRQISGVNISLVPVSQYCYPPSLWYFANSAIKTSADDSVHSQYTPQNATWSDILSHYTQGSIVTSSTRSVAIVDQMCSSGKRMPTDGHHHRRPEGRGLQFRAQGFIVRLVCLRQQYQRYHDGRYLTVCAGPGAPNSRRPGGAFCYGVPEQYIVRLPVPARHRAARMQVLPGR